MKRILFILGFHLLLLSCNSDFQNINTDYYSDFQSTNTDNVCGCEQPQKELPWLKELIIKAETDKTGNYWGTIWLLNYKGQDIFVTDMMLGSGGIANYFFNCSGDHLVWKNGIDSYCPSDFVGKGHFYVEDEKDFAKFFHNSKLEVIIYSNISH
ncbi:MAG: hypothetical protein ACOXZV_11750 [Bacteroidales bacterium]|jgi:hypothetical protein